jgi:hypothetical protein
MDLFTQVKATLKARQAQVFKLNKDNEVLGAITRTLLDSMSTMLRNAEPALSYDDRKEMKDHTAELCTLIDAEARMNKIDEEFEKVKDIRERES